MSDQQIMIPLHLTPEQAWDLAQFVKRVGWVEYRQNAASDAEAYRIGDAVSALQESLAQAGFAPR